ncbi:MAG: cupredoxin domain-containing protein [Chloroflexi bacterium]|nr:cupredoxin domain-containing protein [Chloroflexota bacterium]
MLRIAIPAFSLFAAVTLAACSSTAVGSPAGPSVAPASVASASAAPSTAASAAPSTAGGAPCSPSTAAPVVDATIADFAFGPDPVKAKVGDVIGWTNADSAPHTATLDQGSCTTATLAKGTTGALSFGAAGTYAYHCNIHPNMKGTIEVSE